MKAVLDTQVWLDWLVFRDPGVDVLRGAHAAGRLRVVIDEACEAELARVLSYDLGRFTLDPDARQRCLASVRDIALRVACGSVPDLPECRDPDDQKFLVLAAHAGADLLVTKDLALLALSGRPLPFRIAQPRDCAPLLAAQ
ncbi:MAG TPA: putative toxin-antitoxin system toxin component, PIN family [Burkholderiales bacterium]|nr:putative toxin-antitoxin system toxin component, PIN family [Burkholderiales bacterium]